MSEANTFPNVIPVVTTLPADLLTPLAVYLKLTTSSKYAFLLESVEGGRSLARYSFIGADPAFVADASERGTRVTTPDGVTIVGTPFYAYLRNHFSRFIAAFDPDLPPFIGGAIGFLGFDCCEWFEPTLLGGEPEATLMFFRSIVAFDHAKQLVKIISLVFSEEATDQTDLTSLQKAAEQRNEEIRAILATRPIELPKSGSTIEAETTSNWDRADFEAAVETIKDLINAGECYQAVLSQCFSRPTEAHPVAIYRALRSLNPSPYMFLLTFGDKAVIGASPEMLVRCIGDRLEYRPIAGTRPRGATSNEDDELADEMRRDAKEVAEHLMLVDLGRNDLGRVAEFGSVSVDTLMSVEKYSHVQHLVSSLSARLRPGYDQFDALAACFPAGTVSGAPKVRAMEIIRSLEPTPRRTYAGMVGYFDYAGNMDTCIAIRTLLLEKSIARMQAGGGIVADSVAEKEFDETVNKAKVLLKALDLAEHQ